MAARTLDCLMTYEAGLDIPARIAGMEYIRRRTQSQCQREGEREREGKRKKERKKDTEKSDFSREGQRVHVRRIRGSSVGWHWWIERLE